METKRMIPMTTCGHCNVGRHQTCPSGVRNGNGSMHLCGCKAEGCRSGRKRCTECNNWTQEEIGDNWKCINKNDCDAEIERHMAASPTIAWLRQWRKDQAVQREAQKALRADLAPLSGQTAHAPTARASRVATTAPRDCTCGCGETTGGGRFRPGHDSKYLNKLVELASVGEREEAQALADLISEAFGKKFTKRVSA